MLPSYTEIVGELMLLRGDHNRAKHFFTRTLEIDSSNQLASKRIKQ